MAGITSGVYYLAHLLVLVLSVRFALILTAAPVQRMGFETLTVILLSTMLSLKWKKRYELSFSWSTILSGLVLISISQAITLGAISQLPRVTDRLTVYAVHLGSFFLLPHYAFTIYVTVWTLLGKTSSCKAEMGLVGILVFSTLNAAFFDVGGAQFSLIYGLTFITALIHIRERRITSRISDVNLFLPILLFLFYGLIVSVAAPYIHDSLEVWFRLSNWIVVFFLLVKIVDRKAQVKRLILLMLILAAIVSLAGLVGTATYASRAGWHHALKARLRVAGMYPNGVGIYSATYFTLSLGLLFGWRSRWKRLSLGLTVLLLICTFLTYSRSAMIGLSAGVAVFTILYMHGRSKFRFSSPSLSRPGVVLADNTHGRAEDVAPSTRKRVILGTLILLPILLLVLLTLIRTERGELASRLYIWDISSSVIRHRPFVGVGFANQFIPAYVETESSSQFHLNKTLASLNAHSLPLEIGESMGLVGLLLFLWLLFAAIHAGSRAVKRAESQIKLDNLAALIAALTALMIPHLISLDLSLATLLPAGFWILLGLILVEGRSSIKTDTETAQVGPGLSESRGSWKNMLLMSLCLVGILLLVVRPLLVHEAAQDALSQDEKKDRAAISRLRLATYLQPLDARLLTRFANGCTDDEAVTAYRRAANLMPYSAQIHNQLAWLYWAQDRLNLALAEFKEAAALDPFGQFDGKYQSDLGLAYAVASEQAQAMEFFQQAVFLNSSSIREPDWRRMENDVTLDAAYTSSSIGEPGGNNRLTKFIQYHRGRTGPPEPSDQEPHIHMRDIVAGLLADIHGKPDIEARRILFRLIELHLSWELDEKVDPLLEMIGEFIDPDSREEARILFLTGKRKAKQEKSEEAEADFKASLGIHDDPRTHHQLGKLYVQHRMMEKGIAELEKAAFSFDPSVVYERVWPLFWKDLARAYRRTGRLEDAVAAYDMAQFLHMPIASYLHSRIVVGRAYRSREEYDKEMQLYLNTIEFLSAWQKPNQPPPDVLNEIANQAALSYNEQGFEADAAITKHEALVKPGLVFRESYLNLFRAAVAKEEW